MPARNLISESTHKWMAMNGTAAIVQHGNYLHAGGHIHLAQPPLAFNDIHVQMTIPAMPRNMPWGRGQQHTNHPFLRGSRSVWWSCCWQRYTKMCLPAPSPFALSFVYFISKLNINMHAGNAFKETTTSLKPGGWPESKLTLDMKETALPSHTGKESWLLGPERGKNEMVKVSHALARADTPTAWLSCSMQINTDGGGGERDDGLQSSNDSHHSHKI